MSQDRARVHRTTNWKHSVTKWQVLGAKTYNIQDPLKTHVGQFLERSGTNSVRGGSGVITRVVPSPFKKSVTSSHPWLPKRWCKTVFRAGWDAKHVFHQHRVPFLAQRNNKATQAQRQWLCIAHVGILLGVWGHLLKRFACESNTIFAYAGCGILRRYCRGTAL